MSYLDEIIRFFFCAILHYAYQTPKHKSKYYDPKSKREKLVQFEIINNKFHNQMFKLHTEHTKPNKPTTEEQIITETSQTNIPHNA